MGGKKRLVGEREVEGEEEERKGCVKDKLKNKG